MKNCEFIYVCDRIVFMWDIIVTIRDALTNFRKIPNVSVSCRQQKSTIGLDKICIKLQRFAEATKYYVNKDACRVLN